MTGWRELARLRGLSPRAIRWLSALRQGKVEWYEAHPNLTLRDWIQAGSFLGYDVDIQITPRSPQVGDHGVREGGVSSEQRGREPGRR